jgi:hypothetical protein
VKIASLLFGCALACLVGCSKNIQTNEAVRQGVLNHLSKNTGLNVGSMDIEVTSVTFRDNEADAVVGFKPKGGTGSGMSMRYTLERKDSTWVVKKKADSGMGHGMGAPGMTMPGTMPGMTPPGAGKPAMPADHPPMGAVKQAPKQ